MHVLSIRKKWRPNLSSVIALVVSILIALPLIGLFAARLTSNQFVRETETSLIAQASIFAEIYAQQYQYQSDGIIHGVALTQVQKAFFEQKFHPKPAILNTNAKSILPERPDPAPTSMGTLPIYTAIGDTLSSISKNAQKTSLAGYIAVDYQGLIIGGPNTVKGSFAQIEEIQLALNGVPTSVLRHRSNKNRRQALNSISRDTGFRVFVTMPAIVDDHVVGAVYLSRTPTNLRKFLYQERQTIAWVAGSIVLAAFLVGFLLWRLLVGPLQRLQQQSERIAQGHIDETHALAHYGTKEAVSLGQSFLSMSERLKQRSESLQSYTAHVTHELKSPLTSITGAVELLEQSSDRMNKKDREKFYRNINDDTTRMVALLDDLRRYAAADMSNHHGQANLNTVIQSCTIELPFEFIGNSEKMVPLTPEDLSVIITQLASNALQNCATKIEISTHETGFIVSDNGNGVDPEFAEQIFDPFFTTNRDKGGTGMGLAILRNIITASRGRIECLPNQGGAVFKFSWDAA